MSELLIYETGVGATGVTVRMDGETVWHLRNVFKDVELDEAAVCANFSHTAADGKNYQTRFFNLDAIISVSYPRTEYLKGVNLHV